MDLERTAQQLIALDSVTSDSNAAVSEYMRSLLETLEFEVQTYPYVDAHGTSKFCLAAKRSPKRRASLTQPKACAGIGFFCHNDVVSIDGWNCRHGGPFSGAISEGRMWGRGSCDMKGPTAAALTAISRLDRNRQIAPIYFFVTGDEECGMSGARLLSEQSDCFAEMVAEGAVGIIGEPTSLQVVNEHKGGCHLELTSYGVAAHSSTAEGHNANWQMIPFLEYVRQLHQRCETESQFRNETFDPPTLTLNLVIENNPNSSNITVGQTTCRLFFRPMPDTDWRYVLDELVRAAERFKLNVTQWPPLPPLDTPASSAFVQTALQLLGQASPHSVSYATDGCCFEQLAELIVIGPGNIAQAHRPDEWIDLDQLRRGVDVYQKLFERYAIDCHSI